MRQDADLETLHLVGNNEGHNGHDYLGDHHQIVKLFLCFEILSNDPVRNKHETDLFVNSILTFLILLFCLIELQLLD